MQPREDKQKPLEVKRSEEERKSVPISTACAPPTPPQGSGQRRVQREEEAPAGKGDPAGSTTAMGTRGWTTRPPPTPHPIRQATVSPKKSWITPIKHTDRTEKAKDQH